MSIYSTLVPENYIQDSKRCKSITNLKTGNVFERNLDPSNRWEVAYAHAITHKEGFHFEYDSSSPKEAAEKNRPTFNEADLKTRSMPALKEIGAMFDVTGRSKDEIIERILAAQNKG